MNDCKERKFFSVSQKNLELNFLDQLKLFQGPPFIN